jgi:hypothetical protein
MQGMDRTLLPYMGQSWQRGDMLRDRASAAEAAARAAAAERAFKTNLEQTKLSGRLGLEQFKQSATDKRAAADRGMKDLTSKRGAIAKDDPGAALRLRPGTTDEEMDAIINMARQTAQERAAAKIQGSLDVAGVNARGRISAAVAGRRAGGEEQRLSEETARLGELRQSVEDAEVQKRMQQPAPVDPMQWQFPAGQQAPAPDERTIRAQVRAEMEADPRWKLTSGDQVRARPPRPSGGGASATRSVISTPQGRAAVAKMNSNIAAMNKELETMQGDEGATELRLLFNDIQANAMAGSPIPKSRLNRASILWGGMHNLSPEEARRRLFGTLPEALVDGTQ